MSGALAGIARGSVVTLVSRILAVVLGLGITVLTARLGPHAQGAFAVFTAVESAMLVLGSGFAAAIARRISHHDETPAPLVGAAVAVALAAGAAVALVLQWLTRTETARFGYLEPLAWTAPLMFLAPNLLGIWLGGGRMGSMARLTLATPLLTLAGIGAAALATGEVGIEIVLWSWAIARALVGIGALVAAGRGGWLGRPEWPVFASQVRFVAVIGVTNLVALLNYKVDFFLVEHYLGRGATGVYSVAVLIAELLWLVSSSITQAAYADIGTRDRANAGLLTARAVQVSLVLLVVLCPLLWIATALILPLVVGPGYEQALSLLGVLLPGVAAYGAASAFSAYFTNHAGRPVMPAMLAGLSLVLNLLFSVVLIPRFGAHGAAAATTLSYVLSVCAAMFLFCRHSGQTLHTLLRPDPESWRGIAAGARSVIGRRS